MKKLRSHKKTKKVNFLRSYARRKPREMIVFFLVVVFILIGSLVLFATNFGDRPQNAYIGPLNCSAYNGQGKTKCNSFQCAWFSVNGSCHDCSEANQSQCTTSTEFQCKWTGTTCVYNVPPSPSPCTACAAGSVRLANGQMNAATPVSGKVISDKGTCMVCQNADAYTCIFNGNTGASCTNPYGLCQGATYSYVGASVGYFTGSNVCSDTSNTVPPASLRWYCPFGQARNASNTCVAIANLPQCSTIPGYPSHTYIKQQSELQQPNNAFACQYNTIPLYYCPAGKTMTYINPGYDCR